MRFRVGLSVLAGLMALIAGPALAKDVGGVACTQPQAARCTGRDCITVLSEPGNVTDTVTGRKFWLDYPCDLKPGEKVVFVLNIHGAGGIGNWQRHYFPASDYVNKYRLVVATPTAATATPVRRWTPEADDVHLQNISEWVIANFGKASIKSFWLAGHSQGGFTSSRIVCTPYFANKVDGWLSLSGGRVGQAPFVAQFGPPVNGGPPPPRPAGATPLTAGAPPACDISHIFTVGQYEIERLPETSPLAAKYSCAARVKRPDIVDSKAGYVWDYARAGYKVWGTEARPGKAEVFVYPSCRDRRLVADVVRLDKGHTEGLEPKVTEELVRLMADAPGGKLQRGS